MSDTKSRQYRKPRQCLVCGADRVRKLTPHHPYKWTTQESVFCSQRCAADYGLLQAGLNGETWCSDCGHYSQADTFCHCPIREAV